MKCCETSAVCLKCKWRTEVREMCSGLGGDAGDGKESEWKHWWKWIKMCPANLRGTIVSARCVALRYMTEDVIWQHLTGRYEKRRTWWTCCLLVHEERRSTGPAWSLSQSEGSSRGSFFSLFLEDAPSLRHQAEETLVLGRAVAVCLGVKQATNTTLTQFLIFSRCSRLIKRVDLLSALVCSQLSCWEQNFCLCHWKLNPTLHLFTVKSKQCAERGDAPE